MKIKKQPLLYLLPFIVLALLLLTSTLISRSKNSGTLSTVSINRLPNINLPLLLHPSNRFTSKALEGKVYLLNIWASWCPACRAEHSALMNIKEHFSTPIYGINFKDNPENATHWLKTEGNPYIAIGADVNGTLATPLDINGIPETILLDKHGIIRYRYKGSLTMEAWESTLQPLIEQLTREQ